MMTIQLLLLLALVGPLCAFTSPSVIRGNLSSAATDVTSLAPKTADHTTDVLIPSSVPEIKSAVVTDKPTAMPELSGSTATLKFTSTQKSGSELHTSVAPKTKETPKFQTTVPPKPAYTTVQVPPMTTGETETKDELIDDQGTDLTTGQIVGIIIGALLAVFIVAAVVIAAVRRMGKYSP